MARGKWLWLAAGAGLLAGHFARRWSPATPPQPKAADTAVPTKPGREKLIPPYLEAAWQLSSTDRSLETLRGLPAGARRIAETALWLSDADAREIAAWYPALLAEKPVDGQLLDLLMVRWMELDPRAALGAVKGREDEERRAWWSWGLVDPEAAIRECEARNAGYQTWIMRGAAFVNPRLAVRLMEEHPAMKFPGVEDSIRLGLQNGSWQDALDYSYSPRVLRQWAQDDPERAFDWALDHAREVEASNEGGGTSLWATLVAELDAAQVKEKLATLPPGGLREMMEMALLRKTLDQDVEAALAMAKEQANPDYRSRMLVEIGTALGPRDSGRSLELFREFVNGGMAKLEMEVIYPESSPSLRMHSMSPWLDYLVKHDGPAAMEIARAAGPGPEGWENQVAGSWAAADFPGYKSWAAELPEGPANDRHFQSITRELMVIKGDEEPGPAYQEALQWSGRLSSEEGDHYSLAVIRNWIEADGASAQAYFAANGSATEEQRRFFKEATKEDPE